MYAIETQIKRWSLPKRKHSQLMKAINRNVMERHARNNLPNHFVESAYEEYNARPRTEKYNRMKMRTRGIGHIRPNVRSGVLRRTVLKNVEITATQYGSKLKTRGEVKHRMQTWQKREIAVISHKEIEQHRKRSASDYKRGALSPKYSRKRKRRMK
jgi:hypothetical protein